MESTADIQVGDVVAARAAISIEITSTPVLSYALAHNRVPVVSRLAITNLGQRYVDADHALPRFSRVLTGSILRGHRCWVPKTNGLIRSLLPRRLVFHGNNRYVAMVPLVIVIACALTIGSRSPRP